RTQQARQQEDEQQRRQRLASARSALLLERQQSRVARLQRRELDHANDGLARARRQQQTALEKECGGGFDEDYFAKFNSGRR
ncbi:hypothetical protein CRUP_032310, partial [Coryphaenoides rupestris]